MLWSDVADVVVSAAAAIPAAESAPSSAADQLADSAATICMVHGRFLSFI